MNKMGLIESGKFKGRRILLKDKVNPNQAEWWIEDGVFLNGAPKFTYACIKHELLNIPSNGCPECKKEL